jgi:hypothetical protein
MGAYQKLIRSWESAEETIAESLNIKLVNRFDGLFVGPYGDTYEHVVIGLTSDDHVAVSWFDIEGQNLIYFRDQEVIDDNERAKKVVSELYEVGQLNQLDHLLSSQFHKLNNQLSLF